MRDSRLIDSESANLFSGYWIVNVGSGFRSECLLVFMMSYYFFMVNNTTIKIVVIDSTLPQKEF